MKFRISASLATKLQTAVLVHVAVLVVASSWIYGGNIWWARPLLAAWASLGVVLTLAAIAQPGDEGRSARRKTLWLIPWAAFVVLVLISCLNPSFFPIQIEGQTAFVHRGALHENWPSTVQPRVTLLELWFGAGVYLAAFNLLLTVTSRRALRKFLIVCAVSAVLLAVLGTMQKLSGRGYYFGAEKSPNPRFFSTFIYYNHWGAFMVLWLAAIAGMIFHHATRHQARNLWHSPFMVIVMAALFLALTGPVSASRSATAMTALIMLIVVVHALVHIAAHRRARKQRIGPPIAALLILVMIAIGSTAWLANRSINERYADTRLMLSKQQPFLAERMDLYRDTWTLAKQQPVFGWGLGSYGTAFMLIRSRPLEENRQYESIYEDAHSDWLESITESGFVGTTLLVLMGILPLCSLRSAALKHPVVVYPLLGCGVIALYAWLEFPFGNGAVIISFWALLFAGIRYGQLHQSRLNTSE